MYSAAERTIHVSVVLCGCFLVFIAASFGVQQQERQAFLNLYVRHITNIERLLSGTNLKYKQEFAGHIILDFHLILT